MNPRRQGLSELFALFFDPRVPVLFLLGSIVLAILGNGIYDLILAFVGETPQTLGYLAVGALLIFIGIVLGFWALLRARSRRISLALPPEQQAEPHAGLILPVGLNPQGAEREIIRWHLRDCVLRHCWMIVSPEVEQSQKFNDLRFWLMEQNVEPHVLRLSDPNQAHQSYAVVKSGLQAARQLLADAPVIVDITGGLKPMTAGAVLACRDEGVPLQYLVSARDMAGNPDPAQSLVMKVNLDADDVV